MNIFYLLSVKELLWYISPHVKKFQSKLANLPKPFLNLCEFNNPKRHGHKGVSLRNKSRCFVKYYR